MTKLFEKILIANRGEIAVRIIRTCKDLGIKTVAIYSEADKDSLHRHLADESFCVGPPRPELSYLNIPSIISTVEITGADAVHPGYGFLAENPQFAEICEQCGITFIGPSSKIIKRMGNKLEARKIMKKAGIPIILGSEEPVKDEKEALDQAEEIGFPVIIKASAGGGGKGMQIVRKKDDLGKFFKTAQCITKSAFGNSELLIEKYSEDIKHIEFQILADNYGNIIHLGERDCSVQRRHQKLIEEAPAPKMTKKRRKEMGEVAVAVVKAVSYNNIGTVEFLLTESDKYYFLEVNTRIQVEHPVTEMVYGIDLVKEQIELAAGKKLKLVQSNIKPHGHAIEFRINAEDPVNFNSCPGTIDFCHFPGGIGVRVDSHIYSGCEISHFYDSLLGKLIVWGKDRKEAISRAKRALDEFAIISENGLKTIIPFHQNFIETSTFKEGKVSTDFVSKMG